jgi:hypothetical protein
MTIAVWGVISAYVPPKRCRLIDRDLSRDRLLCLLQRQGQDAVIELGADLLLVDLVRQRGWKRRLASEGAAR